MTRLNAVPTPAAPPVHADGVAYLTTHASRRPVWSVELSAVAGQGSLTAARRFLGIAGTTVSEEVATLSSEGVLQHVAARQSHLGEDARADVFPAGGGRFAISYRLDADGAVRERTERISLPVVTLSSLPLFAAAHAAELSAGRVVKARFPVLKVMRSATVVVRADLTADGMQVRVTPTNPLLRLLFGTTAYRFDGALSALTGYRGLLDPRDRKPNGRWHEYLGSIELARPLPLPGR